MRSSTAVALALCFLFFGMGAAERARSRERTLEERPLPEIKKDCSTCHRGRDAGGPGALKKKLSDLCIDCHADRVAPEEHTVDIIPSGEVKGLPLTDGRLTCFTCHDPHRNPHGALLRRTQTELCLACHPK